MFRIYSSGDKFLKQEFYQENKPQYKIPTSDVSQMTTCFHFQQGKKLEINRQHTHLKIEI